MSMLKLVNDVFVNLYCFVTGSPIVELYTQDARAELIKEQHDGIPATDHRLWMFKPLR